ncbi:hypothetical protein M6B38_261795 [Iris pallida]|uniref:Uncharacterized protein n=1 Tax=Iris pallida TaxID=29817 RepID=A0AAX6GX99_IRIPA|nr:hypothetical protein M6B38_340950 [Iris pallida]KAJ6851272.1 hypothetical protein M6B38_261795 [Iris pallida]
MFMSVIFFSFTCTYIIFFIQYITVTPCIGPGSIALS